MIYEVWHATEPRFADEQAGGFPDGYEKVAEVDAESVDHVFDLTNHIDHDWTTNREVTWRRGDGRSTRSTSVGDVVVLKGTNSRMACAPAGWRAV